MNSVVPEAEIRDSKKVLIIVAIIVAIILIAGIAALSILSLNSQPAKVISKFESAVKTVDVATAKSILVSNDPMLVLNEGHVKQILTYLDDKPSAYHAELDVLKDQLREEEAGNLYNNYDSMLTLVKHEGILGLFDTYKIAVQPYYFTVYTNQKGVVIKLDGNNLVTSKADYYTKVIGPLMPGTYKLDAQFDSEYVSLNTEKKVILPDDHDYEIDLSIDAQYVYLESNYPEAKLYLNGEDTKLNVGDTYRFGPIASNGTMTVQAKLDNKWGALLSDPVKIDGSESYINLDIQGYTIYPSASVSDAEVIIDGKGTGLTFQQSIDDGIGPFPYNKSIKVAGEYKFPWGTSRSNEIELDSNNTYYGTDSDFSSHVIFSEISKELRGKTVSQLNTFIPSLFDSLYQYDSSLIVNVDDEARTDVFDEFYYDLYNYSNDQFYPVDATYSFDDIWVSKYEKDIYFITIGAKINFAYNSYDYWNDSYDMLFDYFESNISLIYDAKKDSLLVYSFYPYTNDYGYYDDVFSYNDVDVYQFKQ